MADESNKAAKESKSEDDKYPRQRLIDEAAEILDLEPPVVAGALATIRGDGDVTADEAKAAVTKFLKSEQKEA